MKKLIFKNRTSFDIALKIISDLKDGAELDDYDVGHADMIVTCFTEEAFFAIHSFLSVARLWAEQSFCGQDSYSIEEAT